MSILRIANKQIETDDIHQVIIDHFPDIVHCVDGAGKIVFTNQKAEQLLGYSRKELIGMPVRNIYADEILQAMEKGFSNLKTSGDKQVESILKDRFGNRIPVEVRSFSIYDNDGNFQRTFSILRDIRKLKELQEGLVKSERLAAVGEMAFGVIHDVSNPIATIRLCLELVAAAVENPEPASDPKSEIGASLADIGKAVESIEKLASRLRKFARRVEAKPQVFDINGCVEDAMFLLRSKLTKHRVQVKEDLGQAGHYVNGFPDEIDRVFANLMSNACEAMSSKEDRLLTLRIQLATRGDGSYWRCDVIDTGCGIPADKMDEIFRPFYTTREKDGGSGLGLAIVRGIIQEHGGFVEVFSEPDKGSIFTLYLPAAAAPDATGEAAEG